MFIYSTMHNNLNSTSHFRTSASHELIKAFCSDKYQPKERLPRRALHKCVIVNCTLKGILIELAIEFSVSTTLELLGEYAWVSCLIRKQWIGSFSILWRFLGCTFNMCITLSNHTSCWVVLLLFDNYIVVLVPCSTEREHAHDLPHSHSNSE